MTIGCHSGLTERSVPLAEVLAGPHELRLSVSPKSASPGDHVTVTVEFENTGKETLWIPRDQETCLWYEQGGASGGSLLPSACDGLRHVKVSPGRKVSYEKDFVVPALYGEIRIYVWNRRDAGVSLEVRKESLPSSQPTPGS